MRIIPRLVLPFSVTAALFASASFTHQALAQKYATAFTGQPPSFISAGTPNVYINQVLTPYYFTINLPPKAIESLGQVTIQQQISPETIQFNLERTQAFQETQAQKRVLTIKNVSLDPKTQTISITFDPPISPGTTVTILLEAQRNPSLVGVYFFDITAYPAGTNPTPLALGAGRFHFHTPL